MSLGCGRSDEIGHLQKSSTVCIPNLDLNKSFWSFGRDDLVLILMQVDVVGDEEGS